MIIKGLILREMTLSFTRKIKFITVFVFLLTFLNCMNNKKEQYKAKFYTKDKEVLVKSFLYEYEGALYINLNKNEVNLLSKKPVMKIELTINNTPYIALPANLAFSKENINSSFVFPVENKTKNIVIEKNDNKYYIPLISEKELVIKMIEDSIINPLPLNFDR